VSEWKKYPKREEPQPQQQPQEAKRESGKWTEILTLFHQGNGEAYKKLSVQVSSELKVVLSITEGRTGGEYTKINFQLSEQELIYLAEKLRHLFFRLGK
jgi:arabinogalactan endo-1,4-beta-galactosidase